jgi:hypothetical protein
MNEEMQHIEIIAAGAGALWYGAVRREFLRSQARLESERMHPFLRGGASFESI